MPSRGWGLRTFGAGAFDHPRPFRGCDTITRPIVRHGRDGCSTGFSPLVGGLLSHMAGWRSTFWLVAALTLLLGLLYSTRIGETHLPTARRTLSSRRPSPATSSCSVTAASWHPRWESAWQSAASWHSSRPPCHSDGRFGPDSIELGYFFAVTGVGRVRRWNHGAEAGDPLGAPVVAMVGCTIALAGSIALLAGSAGLLHFSVSMSIFLFGIGLLNPLERQWRCSHSALAPVRHPPCWASSRWAQLPSPSPQWLLPKAQPTACWGRCSLRAWGFADLPAVAPKQGAGARHSRMSALARGRADILQHVLEASLMTETSSAITPTA